MRKETDGFDYRRVTVKRGMVPLYTQGYRYFGWKLVASGRDAPEQTGSDKVELEFRRDRKIRNKAELTRLQRSFDACVEEICEMERKTTDTADKAACGVGLMGSVFLCCSALLTIVWELSAGLLLAIPGFFGWLIPGFLHKGILRKKTREAAPLIEQKYDEIHHVCQKASGLTEWE